MYYVVVHTCIVLFSLSHLSPGGHDTSVLFFILRYFVILCFMLFVPFVFLSVSASGLLLSFVRIIPEYVCVVSSTMACHCNAYSTHCITMYQVVSLCRGFVTIACISLGRRIGTDTGCAKCRRVERTV